jgi:GntR family transcriptional regulator
MSILENEADVTRFQADPSSPLPIPLYEHVKRRLAEAILLGDLPPGTVLPGEVALAEQYGVAVGTMRRALSDLTADGMLMRRRKTGTVVTGRTPQHSLRFFFQYYRLHRDDGGLLTSRAEVIAMSRTPADEAEATTFGEAPGEPLIRIERLRWVEERPVMRSLLTMVARRLPGFPDRPEAVPQRIYLHLLDTHGIRIAAVRERFTAGLADVDDRRLLRLPDPTALLIIDEEAFDQAGRPTIVSRHRTLTDGHCCVNEIR